jgi:6-phosphogluconate dehydrogenase
VQEAVDLAAPAPVITLALMERFTSRDDDSYAHRMLSAMRNQFGGHAIKKRDS